MQEEIKNTREEVRVLKEKLAQKTSPSVLIEEIKRLQIEKQDLEKQVGNSSTSIHYQFKNCLEFTEDLNAYIKRYLETRELDNEQIIKKRVDEVATEIKLEYAEKINEAH
jgi:hypothetical protein